MATETFPWDSAANLRTSEEVAAYIDAALEENDPALLAHALGVAVRARGMGDNFSESLSSGDNPSFSTVCKVLSALGVALHAVPAGERR